MTPVEELWVKVHIAVNIKLQIWYFHYLLWHGYLLHAGTYRVEGVEQCKTISFSKYFVYNRMLPIK
jgi:hypothetical protein